MGNPVITAGLQMPPGKAGHTNSCGKREVTACNGKWGPERTLRGQHRNWEAEKLEDKPPVWTGCVLKAHR